MLKKTLAVLLLTSLTSACAPLLLVGAAGGSATVLNDRRTLGTQVEDQNIELKAEQYIRDDADLYTQANINVISYNQVVLLVGQAPSDSLKLKAENLVKTIDKVKRIHNEIRLLAPSASLTSASDAWITSKVKSNLVADANIESNRIKIYTENGEVFLMGLVTNSERAKAVDVARHVKGVQRVVEVFELID